MKDVTEFLASIELNPRNDADARDGHLSGFLPSGARPEDPHAPRQLLRAIPGLEFREMPLSDICCGSAGIYNVLHTDMSMQILEKKMEQRELDERGGHRDGQSRLHAAIEGRRAAARQRPARGARDRDARRSLQEL